MTRVSRVSGAGLTLRHFAAGPGGSVLVAAIVLVTAFISTAVPRLLDAVFTSEVRFQIAQLSPTERDLVATVPAGLAIGSGSGSSGLDPETDAVLGQLEDGLEEVRSTAAEPLIGALGQGRVLSVTAYLSRLTLPSDPSGPQQLLQLAIDPRVADDVTIVSGDAPAPTPYEDVGFSEFLNGIPVDATDPPAAIEVMLTAASAEALDWQVGEEKAAARFSGGAQIFRLSGIFEARDAGADYWAHAASILTPVPFDDGNSRPTVTATAYVDAASAAAVAWVEDDVSTRYWYPVSADDLTFAEAEPMIQALRAFSSVSVAPTGDGAGPLRFQSEFVASLTATEQRAASAIAVFALIATGPLAVILAVLALAARLVLERRRSALTLLGARGASLAQVRLALAAEGAVIGIPAAMLGAAVAILLLPAQTGTWIFVLPAVLAIAPIVFLIAAAPRPGLQQQRADLGGRVRSGARVIGELIVLGLAAVAVFLLLTRGVGLGGATGGADASGPSIDPLLTATPALLILAACVLVLRLYPVPLRAIERALRRGPGFTAHLGAARAVRDPSAGLASVLALVVGVSVAVFSGVVFTTLDRGVADSAAATVGADLQFGGVYFSPELVEQVSAADGVAGVAAIDSARSIALRVDNERTIVTVIVADTAALGAFRSDVPAGMEVEIDGAIPVVMSSDLAESVESLNDSELTVEGAPVTVTAAAAPNTGLVADSEWVLVDQAFSAQLTGVEFRPRLALVDLEPGATGGSAEAASATPAASATSVIEAVRELAGADVTVLSQADAVRDIRSSPIAAVLRQILIGSIAFVALLGGLAVVLTSLNGARSRGRLLALLSTLGLSSRQARGLAAWEIGPIAVTAIVAGVVLGIGLPVVLLGSVDLTPFTGGSAQPVLVVDPLLVLSAVAGFTVVVVVAVGVAVAVARRVSAASALRMGEQ